MTTTHQLSLPEAVIHNATVPPRLSMPALGQRNSAGWDARSLRAHNQLSDVGPTCLELMGLSTPDRMTGVSLLHGHHNVYVE